MKIKKQYLRNSEYIQFIKDFILVCEQQSDVNTALSTTLLPLKEQLNKLNTASRTKDIEITNQLTDLDNKREDMYKGLKMIIKSHTKHWDANISVISTQASDYLVRHIKDINALNYPAETEKLDTLIIDLKKFEEENGLLTALNILSWVNKLEEYNTNFNQLYIQRNSMEVENETSSVTTLKYESFDLYNNVIALLDGIIITKKALSEDSIIFEDTKKGINNLISKYNDIQSLRNRHNTAEE